MGGAPRLFSMPAGVASAGDAGFFALTPGWLRAALL